MHVFVYCRLRVVASVLSFALARFAERSHGLECSDEDLDLLSVLDSCRKW